MGYVIFYNPIYFKKFIEILMIWNGGMSFHGGFIGIYFSLHLFLLKKININTFYFLDLISMSAPIGIFLGRISNFINSELIWTRN